MKVVTAAQMAAIEQASERVGVSADTLMENAGLAVAQAAREELGGAAGVRVVVLVGPGNNGADGLVAARRLRRWGAEVACCLLTRRPESDPKLELARQSGVDIISSPDLYWSFVVPLAALFDWGRKMFERGKVIREAQKARMMEKAHEEGRKEGRENAREEEQKRIREALEKHGVTLSPEVAEAVFGDSSQNAS